MIKSRKIQIAYLAAACTVGVFGILASVGLFEADFRWDFYIYFTNVSNYLCVAVMIAELSAALRSKDDGYIDTLPKLKFAGMIGIALTFLMFNAVMAPTKSAEYLLSFRNISLHVLMPILYVLDWFLFYERGKARLKYPLISLIFPISYMAFVLIHAAALRFDSSIPCYAGDAPLIYPYFFLDYGKQGAWRIVLWVAAIILLLAALGYVFLLLDRASLKK